jgi:hypothetical protein
MTTPQKETIRLLSQRRHVTMANLIREAVLKGIHQVCPNYQEVYTEVINKELERIKKYD